MGNLASIAAALVYLVLNVVLVGTHGPFDVFFIQAVLAAFYTAAAAHLSARSFWTPIAVVGATTLLLPFVILTALAFPIYQSLPAAWGSMSDVYSSEWQMRGGIVAIYAFGPIGISAVVALAMKIRRRRQGAPLQS
jgi:hypothetical protein